MAERNDLFRMAIRGHAIVEGAVDAGIAEAFGGETPPELRRLPYRTRLALYAALAPFDIPPEWIKALFCPECAEREFGDSTATSTF
jgi:hypothetical protein